MGAAAGLSSSKRVMCLSDDGDVIDCVDVYQQPALKHAPPGSRLLRQLKPEVAAAASLSTLQGLHPTRRKRGRCPPGTVAIRRDSPRANPEVARRASPFGRPATAAAGNSTFTPQLVMDNMKGKVEVAAAYACNMPYLGARATVPYWKVDVHPDELSMNYLLIGYTLDKSFTPFPGSPPPKTLTNQIAVGLVDPTGENWWVTVMDHAIGYYPETVFDTRFPEASYVEMGGRVLDTRPGGNHTTTPGTRSAAVECPAVSYNASTTQCQLGLQM
ncbi:uncharacterized protein LOC120704957 [Panicum virgatum]|uniref:uncharacterized protein LOC120704957 n=1 Tax=Panicum virgatum TaxID=38727 RepID=UPI0019D579FB|nr:uncharacterized protein LOC120704957 [Panicum virgatum]